MNAPDKFAQLLTLTREPFPGSTKTYLEGSRPDLRVPVRDIALTNGAQASLYDTSGPYTDPQAQIDVRRGLPALRAAWIEERGDTETLTDLTSEFGRARATDAELDELRFPGLHRKPLRAKAGANVSQMHYARKGIITPEMEYVAIRENNNRRAYQGCWHRRS